MIKETTSTTQQEEKLFSLTISVPTTGAFSPSKAAQGHAMARGNPNQGLPRNINQLLIYAGETMLDISKRVSVINRCALFTEKFLVDYFFYSFLVK